MGPVQKSQTTSNLAAGPGVALREAKMASGHGFADYLLFVNGKVETGPGDETDDELIAALAAIR
jgi:hypothetical protein